MVMEDGGFVVIIDVRTTAPLGENFFVRQQLWGATLGAGKCRFRVTMQVRSGFRLWAAVCRAPW